MDPQTLLLLPLWYVAFLLSLTCHEAAHALVAREGGDRTADLAGQVTLNPLPHLRREPFGTILIPLITYVQLGWMMGWASAPYDPVWARHHPRRAALMALAGPAANVILAVLAFSVLKAGLAVGAWIPALDMEASRLVVPPGEGGGVMEGLGRFASVVLFLNLILAVFNLLPFPPMDGAAVLGGFLSPMRALYEKLAGNPLSGLLGLAVAWLVFPPLFRPVLGQVLRLLFA